MKVTQEKLPASQVGLEIEISAETSKNAYEKVIQNLARSAQIPGFRPGKVPRPILIQRMGQARIKATVVEDMIQSALDEAIKQEDIESLGNLKLVSSFEELVEKYQPGEPLIFSASVDVPPTVEPGDYQNLTITAEETDYDPQEVETWLSEKQEEKAILVPVEDRAAQLGDVAIIDYEGKTLTEEGEEAEAIQGVQGTDFRVDLVEGRFIDGMIEGIAGMSPEETKDLTLTFPEDYPREDLAGKPVVFTITLKEVKAKELPELDDDFAQDVSEFETFAELKESLEKRYSEQAETATKNSIHEALTKALVEISTADLPETLIERQVNQMLTQTAMQMEQMGMNIRQLFNAEMVSRMRVEIRPEAIERLTQALVLQKIAQIEGITATPEEVDTRIQEISEQLAGQDVDPDRLQEVITEEITTQKTLDWLQEKASITLVPKGTLDPETDEIEDTIDIESVTAEEE
ncbi:trigger factor [Aphanothece hegewaldii CCALA 016]|uniref:Trigger factor n=1 Tax=Aphanothece hegewaldii CCALA 016 TaxID=2107694 RepID=A0A2T1LRZ9_9CHRO|nr:trigger factor [Aphanothece hegewaldii]PSF31435.1 trigger factor [Aphanothece hegewaldii CCALA 016]